MRNSLRLVYEIINTRWVKVIILASILLVGSIPRFAHLDHPSFTFDEMHDYWSSISYYDSVSYHVRGSSLKKALQVLANPVSDGYLSGQLPFVVSLGFYKLLGYELVTKNEWVARSISSIASLLTICVIFFVSKRMFGYWWAIMTALMVALCPFYISCSRLAFSHGHVFFNFLVVLGLYGFLKISDHAVKSVYLYTFLSAFFLGLALGSDLLAAFWVLSAFIGSLYWNRKTSIRVQIGTAVAFLGAVCFGVFVASPMYIRDFRQAMADVIETVKLWDSLRGYLWLGRLVEKIPASYYLVVALVKLTPIIACIGLLTIVLYVHNFKTYHPFYHYLVFCFWPIIYLSVKPGKSPYYLSSFIPVFYLLITGTLRRLFRTRLFASSMLSKTLLIVIIVSMEVFSIFWIHPDYLMLGIQYNENLYGEFQGPAVSHGQWIGEALAFIKRDSGDEEPFISIFRDIGNGHINYYGEKYGLKHITTKIPPELARESPSSVSKVDYIVLNQDAKKLFAPLHKETISKNRELVLFLQNSTEYKVVKTFLSGSFPMVWVYKKITP